jgi:glycosyltransferase involved in cell wall biosynthesis
MTPTFSVCIPMYNGGAYIERAIESVLEQRHPDWELRLVDDGSTDDSIVRARTYDDPRIVVEVGEHLGLAGNWSRALRGARAPYSLLLGQDDALLPEALERLTKCFAEHPEVGLIGFGGLVPDGARPMRYSARRHAGLIRPVHVRRLALTLQDTPPPSQTAYRTNALAEVGYFDPVFAYCPEIDLQYRLGAAGHWGLFLEEGLTHRNNDEARLTSQVEWTPIPLRDHYRLLCQYGTANDPALVAWQRQRLRLSAATLVLRALKHRHPRTAVIVSAAAGRCELQLQRALRASVPP